MISLSASGGSVVFTFTNSTYYLYGDGTITVPVNSLSLVIDNSNIATFKKAATNDIFVAAPVAEFGLSKSEIEAFYKENMVGSTGGGGGSVDPEDVIDIVESATSYFDGVEYDSATSRINFKHGTTVEGYVDAAPFIVDGMVDNVVISGSNLVIIFNSDSGKQPISIPLTDIFDPSNYYTKAEVDSAISAATDDMATKTWVGNQGYITGVDLSDYATLQDVDEAVSGKADTSAVTADIAAAVSGKVDSSSLATVATSGDYDDLLNKPTIPTVPTDVSAFNNDAGYITEDAISGKADTSAVTAVNNVLTAHTADTTIHVTSSDKSTWSGKQDALVSGTNIKTINNQSLLGSGNITISGGSGSGNSVVECTKEEYDSMESGGTVDPTVFYIITDATPVETSGFVQTSAITSAVTSASTNSQIPTAKAVFDAIPTGGTGGSYSAGRGISIANNTISFNLPIFAGTGTDSITEGNSTASGGYSHAEGRFTNARASYSHSEGYSTYAEALYSHVEGQYTTANNQSEHASGQFNVSSKASNTFGDSGNTLFSVGNGTSNSAKHNAFEIRQNGDIYISKDGQDVKLQDQLGGGAASSAITSGDTNAVAGGAVYDKFDEVEQVTAAALNALNDNFGGLKLVKLTQQEYDDLAVKNNNTLYVII